MEKEAHIYIYGIIDSWQDKESSDYGFINLTNVKEQYDNQKEAEEIVVHIHSEGGVVTEGFAIHDYLRSLKKPITTIIDGTCASIATVVLLAGDKRIGTENSKPFIHNPWGMIGGDKEEMRKYADELETIEEDIATFYAAKTNLSKDEALDFMKNETSFTTEQCLSNGFLTEINSVMRAVALLKTKMDTKMPKENLSKEEVKGMFDGLYEKIKNLGKKKEIQNKSVTDATGAEIIFPDVGDDAQEAVGDSATIDGSAAEGEILMPSGESYVFEAGVLTEIKPAEDPEEDDVEALKAKITDLESQLEASQNLVSGKDGEIADLKTADTSMKAEVGVIKSSLQEMEKNIGSGYKFSKKDKPEKKAVKTRQVFKTVEE